MRNFRLGSGQAAPAGPAAPSPTPEPTHARLTIVNASGYAIRVQVSGSRFAVGGKEALILRPNQSMGLPVAIGPQTLRAETVWILGVLVFGGGKGVERQIEVDSDSEIRITAADFR